MIKRICPICSKEFLTYQCRINRARESRSGILYCSKNCDKIGRRKQKITVCPTCKIEFPTHTCYNRKYCSMKCYGLNNRSEKNYLWKGDSASYRVQHHWIVARMGKANHCVHCGLNKIPEGMKRYFQWANVSKKYLRDTSDYISLCVPCHKKFDGYGK